MSLSDDGTYLTYNVSSLPDRRQLGSSSDGGGTSGGWSDVSPCPVCGWRHVTVLDHYRCQHSIRMRRLINYLYCRNTIDGEVLSEYGDSMVEATDSPTGGNLPLDDRHRLDYNHDSGDGDEGET